MQPTGRTIPSSARALIADGDQWNVGWCGRQHEGLQLICNSLGGCTQHLSTVGVVVTINVYQRTFRIGYGNSHGTCFTIDVSGRQYIVTARHVLPGIGSDAEVAIYWKEDWRPLEVRLVGVGAGDVDVAILAAKSARLSPDFPLPAASGGLVMAQDVYFLGFPYNLFSDLGPTNRDFPLAFVKKAIVSSMGKDKTGVNRLFLDGHNNPGFSGGPIVWSKRGQNDYSVAGIVSGYRYAQEPVYDGDQPTKLAYRYNTGIIVAYGIEHALDLISANPVGFQLS